MDYNDPITKPAHSSDPCFAEGVQSAISSIPIYTPGAPADVKSVMTGNNGMGGNPFVDCD